MVADDLMSSVESLIFSLHILNSMQMPEQKSTFCFLAFGNQQELQIFLPKPVH